VELNRRKTLTSIALLFGFGFSITQCGTAKKPTLSHQELKTLLANARTPKDHLKLAAHYRAEAEGFEASAKEHEKLASYYDRSSWQIRGRVATAHCERIASAARDAAGEARVLAAAHEEMAKELENRPR